VGTDARDANGPTMWLDLRCHSDHYLQESLVVHEFGHGRLVDEKKMKSDSRFKGKDEEFFKRNWGRSDIGSNTEDLPEYDPMSIMHYW